MYMNIRDAYTCIIGFITLPPSDGKTECPSLGTFADKYVDCHGLPSLFIRLVHRLRLKHDNCHDFTEAMSRYIAVLEAEWWWDVIEVSLTGPLRTRAYSLDN